MCWWSQALSVLRVANMSIRRVEITVPHAQFDNVLTLLTHTCKIPRWDGLGGVVDQADLLLVK